VTGPRILVVEDNPLNLKLVRDVLEYAGYEVVDAGTGEEGLEVAARVRPDLVLMDLQLPGIDGTEALRRLRAGVLDPAVPVAAVTAAAMPQDRAAAVDAGFDAWIEKPISVRSLPDQVAELLGRRTGS
jgi:two-component system, cell cycle response regulator DivK